MEAHYVRRQILVVETYFVEAHSKQEALSKSKESIPTKRSEYEFSVQVTKPLNG